MRIFPLFSMALLPVPMAIAQTAPAISNPTESKPIAGSDQGQNHLHFVKLWPTVVHFPSFHLQGFLHNEAVTQLCFAFLPCPPDLSLFSSLRANIPHKAARDLRITCSRAGQECRFNPSHPCSLPTHSRKRQNVLVLRLPWTLCSSLPSPTQGRCK